MPRMEEFEKATGGRYYRNAEHFMNTSPGHRAMYKATPSFVRNLRHSASKLNFDRYPKGVHNYSKFG